MITKIDTLDIFNNKYNVDINLLDISVHVYGIAIKDNKILIFPQYDGYDFPGGTAKKGESHIDTLIREFKEETGYTVEPIELLNVYTSFFHHINKNKDYQSYLIFYKVKIIDGSISDDYLDDDEKQYAKLAKWVSIDELNSIKHICTLNIASELIKKCQTKN